MFWDPAFIYFLPGMLLVQFAGAHEICGAVFLLILDNVNYRSL